MGFGFQFVVEYEYEYLLFEYYSNTELFAHLWAGFSKTKFYTQKKRLKAPKTLKMSLKKSNICIFFHSIWKNLHLTEHFYTDTVCGVSDKYEVCEPNFGQQPV